MTEQVSPAKGVHGVVGIPGDKSISHRYAMLTSIAEGDSEIHNYSTGADCRSTLSCMQALGVTHTFSEVEGRRVLTVHGKGIGYATPASHTALPRT
jgi:3-phosphoshikimate 1-carboxyvinyltransferase